MRPQDPFIGREIIEGQFQIIQKLELAVWEVFTKLPNPK